MCVFSVTHDLTSAGKIITAAPTLSHRYLRVSILVKALAELLLVIDYVIMLFSIPPPPLSFCVCAEGVQLLCLIDKAADACRYLQTYGEWNRAAWLAKVFSMDCTKKKRKGRKEKKKLGGKKSQAEWVCW